MYQDTSLNYSILSLVQPLVTYIKAFSATRKPVGRCYAVIKGLRLRPTKEGQEWFMIKVGCCGFPGGMKKYFQKFRLVEVQSTFYKLPKVQTAERWRGTAREDFEFAVKAWQALTHPTTSPTWRKAGIKLSPEKQEKYGFLRPTEEVFEAWERTKEIYTYVLLSRTRQVSSIHSLRFSFQIIKHVRAVGH